MSVEATIATYEAFGELQALLAGVPEKRRPSLPRAQLVALYLAHRYHPKRGYVDETAEQIQEATLVSNGTVRNVLRALDEIGWWVVVRSGNQHRGSQRVPGFFDPEHREPDPAMRNNGIDGEHREPDPANHLGSNITSIASLTPRSEHPVDNRASRGTDRASRGTPPVHREPDLATPRPRIYPRAVNKSSTTLTRAANTPDEDDRQLATTWITNHLHHNRWTIRNPQAVANAIRPAIIELIAHHRAAGTDPRPDLNTNWPVAPEHRWPPHPRLDTPDLDAWHQPHTPTSITRLHDHIAQLGLAQ